MIDPDESEERRRAVAEQAGPFIVGNLRPRFARTLNEWLDRDVPGPETYAVHSELRVLRGLLRDYAAETDPAASILEDL